MTSIAGMAKAIIAALLAGLGSIATALTATEQQTIDDLSHGAWIAAAIITLTTFAATYFVPNRPPSQEGAPTGNARSEGNQWDSHNGY